MKRIAILLLVVIFALSAISFQAAAAETSASAQSLSPSVYFSDLEAGPKVGGQDNKGLFVTIWGRNFGNSRGKSYVTIGDGVADNYPVWTDGKITFQLGPKAATGDIKVVVGNNVSNGVTFTIRDGEIYFVKASGSDTKGDGSWKKPWASIIHAKNSIKPGDTVYACQGANATQLDVEKECIALSSNGEPGKYKALVAYPGDSVTVGNPGIKRAVQNLLPDGSGASYWVVSQFNLIGGEVAFNARNNSAGLRLVGNRITCPETGDVPMAAVCGIADHFYILGNELYNNGKYPDVSREFHSIYITNHLGREVKDIEIGWNIIRDSLACRAIQFHTEGSDASPVSDVRVHDNLIYNIRSNGIYIGFKSTGTWKIYNNILYMCGLGPTWNGVQADNGGITLRDNDANVQIYNNILADNGYHTTLGPAHDAWYSSASIGLQTYTGKLEVHNNIFYQTIPDGAEHYPYIKDLQNNSSRPVAGDNDNLFYGGGPVPEWDTSGIGEDPRFADAAKGDYRLLSTSPTFTKGFMQIDTLPVPKYETIFFSNKFTSRKDYSATYLLGSRNTGKQSIEFDVIPKAAKVDALIGYTGSSATPDYKNFFMSVMLDNKGFFTAGNAGGYSNTAKVAYAAGKIYHIRVTTDLSKRKYSVFVTAPGKKELQIAKDFACKTESPAALDIVKVSLVSKGGDAAIQVENHIVKATP